MGKIYTILEARTVTRLSRKIKEHYMRLEPGGNWMSVSVEQGQRITIIADQSNTGPVYAGRPGQK